MANGLHDLGWRMVVLIVADDGILGMRVVAWVSGSGHFERIGARNLFELIFSFSSCFFRLLGGVGFW